MDLQSFLRLKQIIGSGANMAQPGLDTSNPDPSANMPGLDNTPNDSTNQNLLSQFQPRHDITDQYTQALTNMPERPVPSNLRRVGAAVAGLGAGSSPQGIAGGQPIGFKFNPTQADIASDKVNYPDYDNQLQDWMNKTRALGTGATEEDRANLNESRRLAGNADREVKQQAVDIKQQQIDIAWQKEQDIYNTKQRDIQTKVDHWNAEEKRLSELANLNRDNKEIQRTYNEARIKAQNARTEMMGTIAEHKSAEQKMQHEKIMAELEYRREAMRKETNTTVTYDKDSGLPTSRRTVTGPTQQLLTDPETGHKYDTSTWSVNDINAAKAKGWY